MSGQHWALGYLGLPWVNGERDCFQFFRQVQLERFERALPPYIVDAGRVLDCVRAINANPERQRWDEVAAPAEGDAVLMSQSRVPTHVGVWVEANGGGVLHCVQGAGVVFSQLSHLPRLGYKVTGFYRFGG